jgi:hypothetical protein
MCHPRHHQRRPRLDAAVTAALIISLDCEEHVRIVSVASVELVVVLLPLFIFRADALHAVILLPRLSLHHAEARGERGGRDLGATAQAV